jgi:hypothetical protein
MCGPRTFLRPQGVMSLQIRSDSHEPLCIALRCLSFSIDIELKIRVIGDQTEKWLQELAKKHRYSETVCDLNVQYNPSSQVELRALLGLWVLYGVAICGAFVFAAIAFRMQPLVHKESNRSRLSLVVRKVARALSQSRRSSITTSTSRGTVLCMT